MKNKKIILIGCAVLLFAVAVVGLSALYPRISGMMLRQKTMNRLSEMNYLSYAVINDNRVNHLGGEYRTTDADECRKVLTLVKGALKSSRYKSSKDNIFGSFCLIVRISDDDDEVRLWFYEDRIELENGKKIAIYETADSKVYETLLGYTEDKAQ